MDHAVKAMAPPGQRGRVSGFNRFLFHRHRFENRELEKLFQRYVINEAYPERFSEMAALLLAM